MIGDIQFKILNEEMVYTGKELRPHFGLEKTGIYGALLVAFYGPTKVPTEHLVDQEDRLNKDFIEAKKMLHIIGEFYGIELESGVLYQRLLISRLVDMLKVNLGSKVSRSGDDIFIEEKKLTVSIATRSNNSQHIQWGVNLDASGAPVQAVGLFELGMDFTKVLEYTKTLLTGFCEEVRDIQKALVKVQSV